MATAQTLAGDVGVQAACGALGLASASFYRWQRPCSEATVRPRPPLALSAVEEQAVLDVLHSERFVDQAPAEAYATLLEEGTYHCSLRTMYRLLDRHGEVRERRNRYAIPWRRAPSSWRRVRTKCGRGTSRSSRGRRSGRTSTSTCCSTSSAATWWGGSWRTASRRRWRAGSSRRAARRKGSRRRG
jgi:putative transposase